MSDAVQTFNQLSSQGGFVIENLIIKKSIKEGKNWVIEIPHTECDLEVQIFFKKSFGELLINKKISALVKALEENLSSGNIPGTFSIEIMPPIKAVIISQPGFWKDFSSKPDLVAQAIESACVAVID